MNDAEYRRTTERDLLGRRYRLRKSVRRGDGSELPAGCIVTIRGKRAGLSVQADPCEHCGQRLGCNRVPPSDLGEQVT